MMATDPSRSNTLWQSLRDAVHAPRVRLLILACAGILMFAGLVLPFPVSGRHWNAAFNLAHAPAFCGLLLLLVWVMDPAAVGLANSTRPLFAFNPQRLILLFGFLFTAGVACEVVQKLVHRHPSISDILANSGGLLAATLYCLCVRVPSRWYRWISIPVAAALVIYPCVNPIRELVECSHQHQEFPLLASFERTQELTAWTAHGATISCDRTWASHGAQSLRIQSRGAHDPGALMVSPMPNWNQFSALNFVLFNPQSFEIVVGITISDVTHTQNLWEPTDRFNSSLVMAPHATRTVVIPLRDVAAAPLARSMEMDHIANLNVFMQNPAVDSRLHVDGILLTR